MQVTNDILKLRTLLSFLKRDSKDCSVSKIARTLGEETYTISRILMTLEKEGLVDRSNSRSPLLTKQGRMVTEQYAERIRISVNHLLCEGVDVHNAQQDAYHWALYNTEKSMEIFQSVDESYRVKHEMSGQKKFGGADLCKCMKDGRYQFPFLIYRDGIQNGSNISWANEVFEHPCTLIVKEKKGMIHLYPKNLSRRVDLFKYLDLGEEVHAENIGTVIMFPVSSLNFINIGSGKEQILHGSVCIKLGTELENAVFTIFI